MADEKRVGSRNSLDALMRSMLERTREMADVNTIVGSPIETADGVTLIPVSKLNFGFASGGGNYGKNNIKDGFAGGGAASVKIEPVAFLIVRDGMTRMLPVNMAPMSSVDRVVDMAPDVLSKVGDFFSDQKEKKERKEQENQEEKADEIEYEVPEE